MRRYVTKLVQTCEIPTEAKVALSTTRGIINTKPEAATLAKASLSALCRLLALPAPARSFEARHD